MFDPLAAIQTFQCSNASFDVGVSMLQGWSAKMEDVETHYLSLPGDRDAAFFAVYDGHRGNQVALYAGAHLHEKLALHPLYGTDTVKAIISSFLNLDVEMWMNIPQCIAGSTATTVLIKNGRIYCGHIGDSKAIACVSGKGRVLSSYDHHPDHEIETKRILSAGQFIRYHRIGGRLAVSRAFGDFDFKRNGAKSTIEQAVIAYPDVTVEDVTPEHEFILLATDGIWEVASIDYVTDFVRFKMSTNTDPVTICKELSSQCLSQNGRGCDNMTVILVKMKHQ